MSYPSLLCPSSVFPGMDSNKLAIESRTNPRYYPPAHRLKSTRIPRTKKRAFSESARFEFIEIGDSIREDFADQPARSLRTIS